MTTAPSRPHPTKRRWRTVATIATLVVAWIAGTAAQYPGWLIPAGGREEKSPVSSVADAATQGKVVFTANCARCHGPEGRGNGPDADYAADLTDELRIPGP